jgi:molecular chaperone Hsp33
VQAMPGASDEVLQQIENNIAKMPPISQLIKEGAGATMLFDLLFTGIEYSLLVEEKPISFACSCNRQRVEKILISLGKEELEQLAAEGQAELTCHFCNQKYQFSKQEIQSLG